MNSELDDIENLSNGKATKSKIGSRNTPHRLRKDEEKQFELAKKNGYLEIRYNQRVNVCNIFEKWCKAKEKNFIVVEHNIENSQISLNNKIYNKYKTRKEAKNAAKEIYKKYSMVKKRP